MHGDSQLHCTANSSHGVTWHKDHICKVTEERHCGLLHVKVADHAYAAADAISACSLDCNMCALVSD